VQVGTDLLAADILQDKYGSDQVRTGKAPATPAVLAVTGATFHSEGGPPSLDCCRIERAQPSDTTVNPAAASPASGQSLPWKSRGPDADERDREKRATGQQPSLHRDLRAEYLAFACGRVKRVIGRADSCDDTARNQLRIPDTRSHRRQEWLRCPDGNS